MPIAPDALSLTEWREIISPTGITARPEVLYFPVERFAAERRIYLFVDTITTGDFVFYAVVRCMKYQTPVAIFPAGLCSFANGTISPNQSVPNMFAAGGAAVGDSLVLQLAKPFNVSIPTVVLQPLRIDQEITHVAFDVQSFAGLIQGYRAFLGVLSTKY